MNFSKLFAASFALALVPLSSAIAHDVTIGDLVLKHPEMRMAPPGARASGGYVTIINTGNTADRLVSAKAPFSQKTEIHTMTMEGDVMKMRELPNGIEIPAGGIVHLQPGGLHIMFVGLTGPTREGAMNDVELTFENAGTVSAGFIVEMRPERRDGATHSSMKHQTKNEEKMDHGEMRQDAVNTN